MNRGNDSAIKSVMVLTYVSIILMVVTATAFVLGMTAFALGTLSIAMALFFFSLGMKALLMVAENIEDEFENVYDRIDSISGCSCEEPCECISEICKNDDC